MPDKPVHFLQIWLQPNTLGVSPAYDQRHFPLEARHGRLVLLVSPDGRAGSIATHQDALLYGALLGQGDALDYPLEAGRRAYVHVARGRVAVNGNMLAAGDGLAVSEQQLLTLDRAEAAEILLFDLP